MDRPAQPLYPELSLLVDGEWIGAAQRDTLPVANPATGETLGHLPIATAQDVSRAIDSSVRSFRIWRAMTALERGLMLVRIAHALRARVEELATVLTMEQGKTWAEAVLEINSTAEVFEWMAEEGRRAYGRVVPSRLAGAEQLVTLEPIGPVAALSPWNYPVLLSARKIATALAAGCPVILKASEETPGAVMLMARICMESGLPAGTLNLLFGVPADISAQLISSPLVQKISFTGSVPVGRHLSTLAGAAMKKITLELGGHSPVIIDGSADIDKVAALAVAAKFKNAGQTCHCPTRFLVHRHVFAHFAERLSALSQALRVGNGLDAGTQMGPVLNHRRVAALRDLVSDAREGGASIATGGKTLQEHDGRGTGGSYWMPTVIVAPGTDCRAMREEPFGPLALVQPYDELEEAVAIANAVDYGLAAYAFTNSLPVAQRLQAALEAGSVSINTFAMTPPELPFSGLKQSGMGSEMGSEGLMAHFHVKAVIRTTL